MHVGWYDVPSLDLRVLSSRNRCPAARYNTLTTTTEWTTTASEGLQGRNALSSVPQTATKGLSEVA